MYLRIAFSMIFLISALGCSVGKVKYTPPDPVPIQNMRVVNYGLDDSWDRAISALGSSPFSIYSKDKKSWIINANYSGDPGEYIDCGMIHSYVRNDVQGERQFTFPASDMYMEYETMDHGDLIYVKRSMNLDGKIHVRLYELNSKQTKISVDIEYTVNKNVVQSNSAGQTLQRSNESISFDTTGSATFPDAQTTCYPSGRLEKQILEVIGR